MSEPLLTDLQRLGDGADPWQLPPPDAIRRLGDRRRRRAARLQVAGAGLACVLLVVAALRVSGPAADPQPAGPVSTPTATPTATPSGDSLAGPHEISSGPRFNAQAVASNGEVFVVVGDSSDLDKEGPAVYWSSDGVHWRPPTIAHVPDSVNVTDVIATDDGFLAVGVGRSDVAAWRSYDGVRWISSPVTPATTAAGPGRPELWGLTETQRGYYAWGFTRGRATLWRSPDGTAWAPVPDQTVFDLPQTETFCTVRDTPAGLRATGIEAPRGSREGHQVAWTSTDGETWTFVEANGADSIWCDSTKELHHWAAVGDAGRVAVNPDGEGTTAEFTPGKE
jgi:hypothetical protein